MDVVDGVDVVDVVGKMQPPPAGAFTSELTVIADKGGSHGKPD